MGALCSSIQDNAADYFDNIVEYFDKPECTPIKNYDLNCVASGSFGCFNVLDKASYNKLLEFEEKNRGLIKVVNEYDKEVDFLEVIQWLNPDDPINGACKFIKPQLTDEQIEDLVVSNNNLLDFEDSRKSYYNLIKKEEIRAARSLTEIFGTELINNTTYRPYNGACVFIITLPDTITFTYTNLIYKDVDDTVKPPEEKTYEYSIKVNEVVLIMNKKCNGDLFNLIGEGFRFNSTKMMNDIGPFMSRIHRFNYTHLDLKLENIFMCDGKYTIADYGSLRKNRTVYDKRDVCTYMFPSYGFTMTKMDADFKKRMIKFLEIANDPAVSSYLPNYNKADPLYYYTVTVPSFFKNQTKPEDAYEHAKYVDKYALALVIMFAFKLSKRKKSTFDEKYITELLDYRNLHYFEKQFYGGNKNTKQIKDITKKLENVTVSSSSIKKKLQKTDEKVKYNGYNYVVYLTQRKKKVIIVKNEKIYVDKMKGGGMMYKELE